MSGDLLLGAVHCLLQGEAAGQFGIEAGGKGNSFGVQDGALMADYCTGETTIHQSLGH